MYDELPYKYKYMINKMVNCIIQYIKNNLSNNLIIEKKLILTNNYILEIFGSSEISRSAVINSQLNKNSNSNTFMERSNSSIIRKPNYENNITFSRLSNVILNIGPSNLKQEFGIKNNEHRKIKISPIKNKEKFKIIKLKKLLQNVQEKNMIKELSYLKKLSFVQGKLNFYEAKKADNNKIKNLIYLDTKNISYKLAEEKKLKIKKNNNTINVDNYLDYLTLINNYRNNRINLPYSNTKGIIKHTISQRKINSIHTSNKV